MEDSPLSRLLKNAKKVNPKDLPNRAFHWLEKPEILEIGDWVKVGENEHNEAIWLNKKTGKPFKYIDN